MTTTTYEAPSTSGYVLDPAWHAERERLDGITRLYDATTLELCQRLGVSSGWRCLDVGAGTGSVAQALSTFVAPGGKVVALDIDTRFLDPLESDHLEIRNLDVTTESLPPAQFDLVHARLLLEHLTEREQVLAAIVQATKPGGWVLVEDFDWSTALVIDPPSATHAKITTAVMDLFAGHGYDTTYGRTLPRQLESAGLVEIGTRAQSVQVRADRERGLPAWELLADQLAPGMLAAGLVTHDDLEQFHELWHDGETVCFSPLMVSCWGRRL